MNRKIVTLFAALLFAVSGMALAAQPESSGSKAGAVVKSMKVTATVEKVNRNTREVTLKGAEGKIVTIQAGPEVRNFDQIKVGDKVNIQYTQALLVALRPAAGGPEQRSETAAFERAAPGEKPSGTVRRMIEVSATVKNVNKKTREVTLKGPERTVSVVAPADMDLSKIKKGEQVVATYADALAMSVESGGQSAKPPGRKY